MKLIYKFHLITLYITYSVIIYDSNKEPKYVDFETYEQALEKGLYETLTMIKKDKINEN